MTAEYFASLVSLLSVWYRFTGATLPAKSAPAQHCVAVCGARVAAMSRDARAIAAGNPETRT
jgi:hypothetical protein